MFENNGWGRGTEFNRFNRFYSKIERLTANILPQSRPMMASSMLTSLTIIVKRCVYYRGTVVQKRFAIGQR